MGRKKSYELVDDGDPLGLFALSRDFIEHVRVTRCGPVTTTREKHLAYFTAWCADRGIVRAVDVTRQICERYQRFLFHYRKEDGTPLTISSQIGRLVAIRMFFKWAARRNSVLYNPASELELRRAPNRIPRVVLSSSDVEQIMTSPDVASPLGLRDRAILETLYSTAIRRSELVHLVPGDVDVERGTLLVREGKGHKDRMVPIGERAGAWVTKYLDESRPFLAVDDDVRALFLHEEGKAFEPGQLTYLVRRHILRSGIAKSGSCHLFRHAAATLMLEGGADIRFIQAMLGHTNLDTTEIYTRVSILKLQAVHRATHPGATLERKQTIAAELAAELIDEPEDADDGDGDGLGFLDDENDDVDDGA